MTTTPTIEMNEVIAKFDDNVSSSFDTYYHKKFKHHFEIHEAEYHSDWNWLMDVWYKFLELRFIKTMSQLEHSDLKTVVGHAILYGEIEVAHRNIYEAIQWYNENQNP